MVIRPEDLKAAMRARAAEARRRNDAHAVTVREALDEALERLPGDLRPRRAWLVGSLSTGAFGARSDVDLVVEGLSYDRTSRLWAELSRALPVGLDLLRIEELDAGFRQRVLDEGSELHVP